MDQELVCSLCDTPLIFKGPSHLFPGGIYESTVSQFSQGAGHPTICPKNPRIWGCPQPHKAVPKSKAG